MTQPRSPGVVPATDVIGGWEAPVEGVIRDRLVYDLGTKALWDAKNVQVRLGKLRERPGFNTSFCQSNFITRPTGALWAQTMARPAFQPNADQPTANPPLSNELRILKTALRRANTSMKNNPKNPEKAGFLLARERCRQVEFVKAAHGAILPPQ